MVIDPGKIAWAIFLGLAAAVLGPPSAVRAQEVTTTLEEDGFTVQVPGVADDLALPADDAALAEADAVGGQLLSGNVLEQHDVISTGTIDASGMSSTGIVHISQATGNLNNQANVAAIAVVEGGTLLLDSEIFGSATRTANHLITTGGESHDRLLNSFDGASGIVGVNQAAGNLNQQANILAVAVGLGLGPDAILLGEPALGTMGGDNRVEGELDRPSSDTIDGSFQGFEGIAQVSQSAGNLNTISQGLVVTYTEMTLQ